MSVPTLSRAQGPQPATPAHEDGTRRRRALVAVGLAALVLVAGLVVLLPRTASLAVTGEGRLVGAPTTASFGVQAGPVLHQVRYEDGAELPYAVAVRNDGPLPVTITGLVRDAPGDRRLITPVGVAEDVHLGAGESGEVVLRFAFDGCEGVDQRSSTLVREVGVSVSVLGVPGNRTLNLPEMLRTSSPRDVDCPLAHVGSRSPG